MTRIDWNEPGTAIYEHGVDRGVLYPRVGPGVPWIGLVKVEEPVVGGALTSYYFDGLKYYDFIAAEDYQANVEAYGAPAEFAACDGMRAISPGVYATQQRRERFGFSYRTLIGNELDEQLAYKLHLVYNCTAAPATRSYATRTSVATPATRSWQFSTVPPPSTTYKPTAHFVVDSRDLSAGAMLSLENRLYGTPSTPPELPPPDEIVAVLTDVIGATITEPIE